MYLLQFRDTVGLWLTLDRYSARNYALRMLSERARRFGVSESEYRVVPVS